MNEVIKTRREDRQLSKMIVVTGIIAMLGFYHMVSWQDQALAIIPLKIKQLTGSKDINTLSGIANICVLRMKHDCVEHTYKEILVVDTDNLHTLEKLAHLQNLRGKEQAALKSFATYFAKGGNSALASHRYARLLQKHAYPVEADAFYRKALSLKTDVVQVTVTNDYVTFLLAQNRRKEASKLVRKYKNYGVRLP